MRYWEVSAHQGKNRNATYLFNVCENHKNIKLVEDINNGEFIDLHGFIIFTGPKVEHKCKYCEGE